MSCRHRLAVSYVTVCLHFQATLATLQRRIEMLQQVLHNNEGFGAVLGPSLRLLVGPRVGFETAGAVF